MKAQVQRMSGTPGSRSIVLDFARVRSSRRRSRPVLKLELLDRAIRSNVTINSLDATGVFTMIPGGTPVKGRSTHQSDRPVTGFRRGQARPAGYS